jgi:outer membrane receptor protein involved in Fe transport
VLLAALSVAAPLFLPSIVFAQSSSASLLGTVRDSAGTPLENVEVRAHESATGLDYRARTSSVGRYWLPGLPPGRYDVGAGRVGLASATRGGITLHVGREVQLDFVLGPRPVELAGIEVTATQPLIETTQSDVSYVLDQQRIATMPQESRRFLDLAQLAPGATSGLNEYGLPFGIVAIGGLRSSSVGVVVDGGDMVLDSDNILALSPPLLAIQEFEVVSSTYAAEYGGSASGIINVVTRRGTNEFQAEGFGLFRDQALNAQGAFEREKPRYRRSHWGVATGGPIVRDRTHFFAALERRDEDQFATVNTGGLFPAEEGTFKVPLHDNLMFARVDHRLGAAHQLMLSYKGQEFDQVTDVGVTGLTFMGGLGALSHGWRTRWSTHDGLLRHRWGLGARTFNEARVHYLYNTSRFAPTGSGPCLEYPSVAIGSNPYDFLWRRWQLDLHDDFSHELQGWAGSHRLRTGVRAGWRYARSQISWFKDGLFLFDSDTASEPFLALLGVDVGGIRNEEQVIGAYVKDEWTPRTGLTFDLGLRYDLQTRGNNPGFVSPYSDTLPFLPRGERRTDANNIAPRLGVAWDVGGAGRTVVRGGAGIFYDHAITYSFYEENTRLMTMVWFPGTTDVLQIPIDRSLVEPYVTYGDDRMATPMSRQASLGVEHALGRDLVLRVDGVVMDARNVTVVRGVQTWDAFGNPAYPGYQSIDNILNRGEARARMLIAQVRKPFSRGRVEVTYTLAKREAMMDRAGEVLPVTDPDDFDFSSELGPTAWDERHRVVAIGEASLPRGFGAALKAVYSSARPYNILTGTDENGDGVFNDRPPGVGRNSGRGPNYFTVDLGLRQWLKTRQGQVALVTNIYNLFNRTNLDPRSVAGTLGSPLFAQARGALAKRQIEVGLQARF